MPIQSALDAHHIDCALQTCIQRVWGQRSHGYRHFGRRWLRAWEDIVSRKPAVLFFISSGWVTSFSSLSLLLLFYRYEAFFIGIQQIMQVSNLRLFEFQLDALTTQEPLELWNWIRISTNTIHLVLRKAFYTLHSAPEYWSIHTKLPV